MGEKTFQLNDDFPSVSYEEWLKLVERDLKGAAFEKRLVTRTDEGFDIQPIYTGKDLPQGPDPSGLPGLAPFTRGSSPLGNAENGWEIRQEYDQPTVQEANAAARIGLERERATLWIVFNEAVRSGLDSDSAEVKNLTGRSGVSLDSPDEMATLFDGLDIANVSVSLDAGANAMVPAALYLAMAKDRGTGPSDLKGSFNMDPLGALALSGSLPCSLDTSYRLMADLASWTGENAPNVRSVLVSALPYINAGASAVQELAAGLATGVEYLRELSKAGLEINIASGQILFVFGIGRDIFMEIAKLRAARFLWAKAVELCGGKESSRAMALHARSSLSTKSKRDPHVNLLRATAEVFSAAMGGAQSIAASPYDEAYGDSDDFAKRIAINTHSVLIEESQLHRVADPAGGSYYIETLTRNLAGKAWELFQEIEKNGGMAKALLCGSFKERIEAVVEKKCASIVKRREPITGVSEFPNIQEAPIKRPQPDYETILRESVEKLKAVRSSVDMEAATSGLRALIESGESGAGALTEEAIEAASKGATLASISAVLFGTGEKTTAPALKPWRAAELFESLRDESDRFAEKTGKRPVIFLANMGPIPKHKARAEWSANFFGAGGVEALKNDGFKTAEECADAFEKSGANAAVICSSDDIYRDMAPSVAGLLKEKGAQKVLLAGRPGEQETAYREGGVDEFIFLGCNVYETLRVFLEGMEAVK